MLGKGRIAARLAVPAVLGHPGVVPVDGLHPLIVYELDLGGGIPPAQVVWNAVEMQILAQHHVVVQLHGGKGDALQGEGLRPQRLEGLALDLLE
jgi:hypothetical protein